MNPHHYLNQNQVSQLIKLLGTSHISPKSIEAIEEEIKEEPDCVAVELDPGRYEALKSGKKGDYPSLFFRILSWLQKKLGEKTGVMPGEEMLTAVETARKNGIRVYLMDRPIGKTISKFKKVGIIEKLKLFIHSTGVPENYNFDLKDVPPEKLVKDAVEVISESAPNIYSILIDERDEIMSMALEDLSKDYENVLAVVGAGHLPGLEKRFKARGVEFEDKTFK